MISIIFGAETNGIRTGVTSFDDSNPQSVMPEFSSSCIKVDIDENHPAWELRSWALAHPNNLAFSGSDISLVPRNRNE